MWQALMCDKKEPVFAFLALILHLVPSSLLPPSHNKEKAMCEGAGGGIYTEESREEKESTLLLGGEND